MEIDGPFYKCTKDERRRTQVYIQSCAARLNRARLLVFVAYLDLVFDIVVDAEGVDLNRVEVRFQ